MAARQKDKRLGNYIASHQQNKLMNRRKSDVKVDTLN